MHVGLIFFCTCSICDTTVLLFSTSCIIPIYRRLLVFYRIFDNDKMGKKSEFYVEKKNECIL